MLSNVAGVIQVIVESTSPSVLTVNVLLASACSLTVASYKLNSKGSVCLTILVVYNGMSSIGVTAPA